MTTDVNNSGENINARVAHEIQELQINIEGSQSLICRILDRLDQLETRVQFLENAISGGVTKSTERAVQINKVVRQKGHLKRGEVMRLLDCHGVLALRAMHEAAQMYPDLHVSKTTSKKQWILAIKD